MKRGANYDFRCKHEKYNSECFFREHNPVFFSSNTVFVWRKPVHTVQVINSPYFGDGWSGGAMVLGKLPVPGRPAIGITLGQEPTALAVSVGGAVWTFFLSYILSLVFPSLFGRRPNID